MPAAWRRSADAPSPPSTISTAHNPRTPGPTERHTRPDRHAAVQQRAWLRRVLCAWAGARGDPPPTPDVCHANVESNMTGAIRHGDTFLQEGGTATGDAIATAALRTSPVTGGSAGRTSACAAGKCACWENYRPTTAQCCPVRGQLAASAPAERSQQPRPVSRSAQREIGCATRAHRRASTKAVWQR